MVPSIKEAFAQKKALHKEAELKKNVVAAEKKAKEKAARAAKETEIRAARATKDAETEAALGLRLPKRAFKVRRPGIIILSSNRKENPLEILLMIYLKWGLWRSRPTALSPRLLYGPARQLAFRLTG